MSDPLRLTVARALEIAAEHLHGKAATEIEQALLATLSGGDVRAEAKSNPLCPNNRITPIPCVDWDYIETLHPGECQDSCRPAFVTSVALSPSGFWHVRQA